MRRSLVLDVAGWAALVSADAAEQLGAAESASIIPDQQRRRLPRFSRDVLRCALPLLREAPHTPVILSSPHGDLHSTVTLLTDVARRAPLSPSLFGLSVHNAPTGALSLCLDGPGDQSAIGGGAETLSAGLIEAYARLATDEATAIVLIHADERLPPIYAELDEDTPGVFFALSLRLAGEEAHNAIDVGAGRQGAVDVVQALASGGRRLRFAWRSAPARAA